jgi:hypothetical protein
MPHYAPGFGRRNKSYRATIELPHRAPIACVVRNLTETGALIETATEGLPTRSFALRIAGTTLAIPCDVMHGATGRYGIAFRLRTAADVAALRKLINDAGNEPAAPQPYADRRRFGRRAVQLKAAIEVPLRQPLECLVTNLSEGGAMLEFRGRQYLPRSFGLRFDCSGVVIPCEVSRATETGCGVSFAVLGCPDATAVRTAIRAAMEG